MSLVLTLDINYVNDVIIIMNMVRISRQRPYHGHPKYICVYQQVMWLENHVLVKCNSIVNMMYMCMIIINKSIVDYTRQQGIVDCIRHHYPKVRKGRMVSMKPRDESQVS